MRERNESRLVENSHEKHKTAGLFSTIISQLKMSKGSTNIVISRGLVSGSNGGQTRSQDQRERSLLTVSSAGVTPRCHQRRWSADLSQCGTSSVIIVKKNRKEPQPPERRSSLCDPHSVSHSSFKCYSRPPVTFILDHSSSSSSSTTSSCSSPPPIQTSTITGPDPLGWKLRLRTTSQSDNAPNPAGKSKPPVRVKPPCRRHSDPSAFLRSLHQLEELHAVRLRPVSHPEEFVNVFGDGNEEATNRRRKTPPAVPEKTAMARQIAQLIALSLQRSTNSFPKTREGNIDGRVMETQLTPSHHAEDRSDDQQSCASPGLTVPLPGRKI
uniref:uncharacterized protein LOC122780128 isoform X1 n=2 Tax=Solea senegalensis TaxID=28829 RepID=UPI001CD88E0E|nr:uncharacterized protein LOC122780128 isoform X1 [Solea senegalensis]